MITTILLITPSAKSILPADWATVTQSRPPPHISWIAGPCRPYLLPWTAATAHTAPGIFADPCTEQLHWAPLHTLHRASLLILALCNSTGHLWALGISADPGIFADPCTEQLHWAPLHTLHRASLLILALSNLTEHHWTLLLRTCTQSIMILHCTVVSSRSPTIVHWSSSKNTLPPSLSTVWSFIVTSVALIGQSCIPAASQLWSSCAAASQLLAAPLLRCRPPWHIFCTGHWSHILKSQYLQRHWSQLVHIHRTHSQCVHRQYIKISSLPSKSSRPGLENSRTWPQIVFTALCSIFDWVYDTVVRRFTE